MSETMTRGAQFMVLHGAMMRHDVGAFAKSTPLPVDVSKNYPVMVSPELFGGLLKMGIKSIESAGSNAISITTMTGLQAKIPVVTDPHRNLNLSISKESTNVDPQLFNAWICASVSIAKAIPRATNVYTYRSNAFVYNNYVMVTARLTKAWPLATVANVKHLGLLWSEINRTTVTSARCTMSEILVETSEGQALRVEAEEEAMPLQPVTMLAKLKAHVATPLLAIDAQALRVAAEQIAVVAQAATMLSSAKNVDHVVFSQDKGTLVLRAQGDRIHIGSVQWPFGAIRVQTKAFAALQEIPARCTEVQIIAVPNKGISSPLVLRADDLSFFMAASGEDE